MKGILWLTLFISVGGCSTSPVKLKEAEPVDTAHLYAYQERLEQSATLVIARDSGLIGGGCRFGFYINGQVVADFETSQKATFYVPAGEYRLGSGRAKDQHGLCGFDGPPKERETTLKAGQTKLFRMFMDQDGNADVLPLSDNQ